MTTTHDHPRLRRRVELSRLVLGALLELGIKAYGVGAATAVALSPAETVGGKAQDAIAAVPSLEERYRTAKYVADHRQEIQDALDYVNAHTLPQAELEQAAAESSATLRDIEITDEKVDQALDSATSFPANPLDAYQDIRETVDSIAAAWQAKPDLGSLRTLADRAEQVQPYLDEVEVLGRAYQGNLAALVDNFASDEIAATLLVMAAALGLALVLGRAVGFWVRRGRPGLLARLLHGAGARVFRRWYVRHLPQALSPPLYAAARERIQRDIVADPRGSLDPEAFRALERHFAGTASDRSSRV